MLLFDILLKKIYNLVVGFILGFPHFILGKHSFNYGCFFVAKKYNKNIIYFNIAIANYSKLCYIMHRNSNSTQKGEDYD